jgi:hypothetical protein
MPPLLTPTLRSDVIANCTILRFGRELREAERREAMRDETTKAAEEERPEPVGIVPSMRICMEWKDGWVRQVA